MSEVSSRFAVCLHANSCEVIASSLRIDTPPLSPGPSDPHCLSVCAPCIVTSPTKGSLVASSASFLPPPLCPSPTRQLTPCANFHSDATLSSCICTHSFSPGLYNDHQPTSPPPSSSSSSSSASEASEQ